MTYTLNDKAHAVNPNHVVCRGNQSIRKGTAIATFVNGRYPNLASGNHAAFYTSQDADGMWIMDQFAGKPRVSMRHITFQGQNADGNFANPNNNADAFSIIE